MDYDDATELRQIARVASATPERVPFAILALVVCLELIIKYSITTTFLICNLRHNHVGVDAMVNTAKILTQRKIKTLAIAKTTASA